MGKGPGFVLTVNKDGHGYSYSYLGGSGSNSDGHPPQDLVAALQVFRSISPDKEIVGRCESLTKGAANISTKANELAKQAELLGERTNLTGDCEYTKLY